MVRVRALMIVVTGLSVTVFTCARMASPLLASLVSTRTTPSAVMNTVVLLPAPAILLVVLIFSIVPVGGIRGPVPRPPPRCCARRWPRRDLTTIAVRARSCHHAPPTEEYLSGAPPCLFVP